MKRRFPGCLFLAIGSLFPILGATMAEEQRRRFNTWMEVPVVVTAHGSSSRSSRSGSR